MGYFQMHMKMDRNEIGQINVFDLQCHKWDENAFRIFIDNIEMVITLINTTAENSHIFIILSEDGDIVHHVPFDNIGHESGPRK